MDIAPRMLEKAQVKVNALGLEQVKLELADAEYLDFPSEQILEPAQFDHVICANTFPWMQNKASSLQLWHQLLKPGGYIGVHTPADTAYIGSVILRQILAKYSIILEASNRIGSLAQCETLFASTGFDAIEINTDQLGSYINIETARATWENVIGNPSLTSPKIVSEVGISQLSANQLAQAKAEFEAELNSRQTEQGVWDDRTTLYILGRKAETSGD